MTKESFWDQMCVRCVPAWGPRETIAWSCKSESWKRCDVGDARAMGRLLRKPTNRVRNQPERRKCASLNKAERSWRSEERFGIIEMQSLEFAQLVLRLLLVQYFLCSPFWHSSVYSVTLYVGSIWSGFLIFIVSLRRDFELWTFKQSWACERLWKILKLD